MGSDRPRWEDVPVARTHRRPSRVLTEWGRAGLTIAFTVAFLASALANDADTGFTWPRAEARDVNIAGDMPDALRAALANNRRLQSFGLVRDGRLVIEHYQCATAAGSYVNIASATKSVVALLVGIAIDRKAIASVDQPLTDFFPELQDPAVDPNARHITLRHLLSMSAGWRVTPADMPPAHAIDALKRPMAFAPGKTFQYDNASSHLIGIVVARAMGMPLEAFAGEHLFRPLGVGRYIWGKDGDGYTQGWSMLHLRLLDMLKIGQLVVDRGHWQGRRVVSADWIDEMLTPHNDGGPPVGIPYAYQWYIQPTPDRQHRAMMAIGSGGQFLYLVPDLRLVVAITHTREQRSADLGFMRTVVLPAVRP